jgi:hypothetical protein
MALGSTQPLTEMSTSNISWGQRRPVRRADNLATFMCRLSSNLGASDTWNPQGLSRPVISKFKIMQCNYRKQYDNLISKRRCWDNVTHQQ